MSIILVIDTETTGIIPQYSSILQLAYIIYDTVTKNNIFQYNEYIKIPDSVEISAESQQIHGITREKCAECGVSIEYAIDTLMSNISKYSVDLIVGHNVLFDKRLILEEAARIGNEDFILLFNDIKTRCTMRQSWRLLDAVALKTKREHWKCKHQPRLTALYETIFGCVAAVNDTKNAHDALTDVVLCLRCYLFLEKGYIVDAVVETAVIKTEY